MLERSTRAAVAVARVGRDAGAFELDVPELSAAVAYLAEQYRAPVAELRHEMAELVSGIQHGQRIAIPAASGCRRSARRKSARAASAAVEIDQACGVRN